MVADKNDSTRSLLAQLEGEWESEGPSPAAPLAVSSERQSSAAIRAALEAAAQRNVDSLEPIAVPTMDELDGGWDEADDDEADEADEADEPLPDARLDPAAYAAAREAREQRLEARRQQRRARAELKKARRRARADAQKQKQKPKQRRARPAVAGGAAPAGLRGDGLERVDGDAEAHADPQRDPGRRGAAPRRVTRAALTGTNGRMLALALVVFLAAALFAAVVTR